MFRFAVLAAAVAAAVAATAAALWSGEEVEPRLQTRTAEEDPGCTLPLEWAGSWYELELGEVEIGRAHVAHKGNCVRASVDAQLRSFLFHYAANGEDCWRCLVFFPHHHNVLKYKETSCQPKGSLEDVCGEFFGDSPLHSLFRLDAAAEPCPVQAPLNFTYSFYRGECRSSRSWVGACASPSQLRFDYQACPESYKANSKVEDIECLGHWEEKRRRYFLGRITNHPEFRPGENFRCFMYSLSSTGGKIGVSADSSCREMYSFQTASFRLDFVRDKAPEPKCEFAKWLWRKAGGGEEGVWESLGSEMEHRVGPDSWTTRPPNEQRNASTAICIQDHDYTNVHKYVVYKTDGCTSGYQCVKVAKRTRQIVEVSRGALARWPHEACSDEFFTEELLDFDTLLLRDSVETQCPNHGRYRIHGCTEDEAQVSFGCTAEHQLVVNLKCLPGHRETLNCHGHWDEAGVSYLVVREQHTGKRSCYVYTKRNELMSLSGFYRHPCRHGLLSGVNGHRVYNASRAGVCEPASAAWAAAASPLGPLAALLLPALLLLLRR